MKDINTLFISVIVKKEEVTAALSFNYEEAEDTMINVLQHDFDLQTDEGLIFLSQKEGEAFPLFNFRGYLNGEQPEGIPSGKSNDHVKFFFSCPKCPSNDGKLKVDEDGDIVMECQECQEPVFVK